MCFNILDGYTDQNNYLRKKLGEKKFKFLLTNNIHLPLKEQKRVLEECLDEHQLGSSQRDDILVIGIKV